jgi:hypothetical protein
MVSSFKSNISDEINKALTDYEKEKGYKPSQILLSEEKFHKIKMYCRDHYLGDIDEKTFKINGIPVLKSFSDEGIHLVGDDTLISLNDLLEDTLNKNDIYRLDKIRSDWFGGISDKTPIGVLNSIPSDIKFLINCIDKLHTENLELKRNLS